VPFARPRTIEMTYEPAFVRPQPAPARPHRRGAVGLGREDRSRRVIQTLRQKAPSTALIVGFFVAWEVICLAFGVSDILLPRPSQIIATLWQRWPALMPHTMQTLYTTMLGFALGVVTGVVLGVMIGSSRLAYETAYPLLVGFSSIRRSPWCRSSCCGSAQARCLRC
jgi:hypothetical protein